MNGIKRNFYMVQANAVYGSDVKSVYLPYASGCLVSFAGKDTYVAENYRFAGFIYTRRDIDEAIASFDSPAVVGFSTYVWNNEYNRAFAKRLKEVYPDCVTVFGGHNISPGGKDLEKMPYADILIHGAGEQTFRDILVALNEKSSLDRVPNITFRDENGETVSTQTVQFPSESYPSPYLDGTFDGIINDGYAFSAIIETNRGCPNRCAFCDWGHLRSKVCLFPMERIKAELDWLSEHKIEYIYCADANFGLFDRDLTITEMLIEHKNNTGYPMKFKVNFTKNRMDFVTNISSMLGEAGMGKSQTVSFQSVSEAVLENIGRKNLTLDYFGALSNMMNEREIQTYSELILGLPGETKVSFTRGLCELLERGQHKSINIYPCELLPNSLMGSEEYINKYCIKTVRAPFRQYHCRPEDEDKITEYSRLIVATSTMSEDDWVKCMLFSSFVQSLHNMGLLRCVALYMRHERNISYYDFYSSLLVFFQANPDTVGGRTYRRLYDIFTGVTKQSDSLAIVTKKWGELTWEPDETAFMSIFCELDSFFSEVKSNFCPKNDEVTDALFEYQYNLIKKMNRSETAFSSDYNFYNYFSGIYSGRYAPLEKRMITLSVTHEQKISTFEDYVREIVWYGRRDEAALYTGAHYRLERDVKTK